MKKFELKVQLFFLIVVLSFFGAIEAIINGRYAKLHNVYGYQVSVRKHKIHNCVGTIVSLQHVITVARCVCLVTKWNSYDVFAGTTSLSSKNGEVVKFQFVKCHPEFYMPKHGDSNRLVHNDVAIIALLQPLLKSSKVFPIRIPAIKQSLPSINDMCNVSGWGETACNQDDGHHYKFFSDKLRFMTVPFTDQQKCKILVPKQYLIQDNHICMTYQYPKFKKEVLTIGASFGDVGAPLVFNDYLIGILSNFTECGTGLPEIYTNIFNVRDFIQKSVPDMLRN